MAKDLSERLKEQRQKKYEALGEMTRLKNEINHLLDKHVAATRRYIVSERKVKSLERKAGLQQGKRDG